MRTPRASTSAAALTVLLLAGAAALRVPPGSVTTTLAAGVAVAPDEGSAAATAVASGAPVEALSDRTEYAEVFANPNRTFTYRVAPVPQRARRADGTWAAVETPLRRQADGSIAPGASPAGLVISGGGPGPLFTVSRGGGRLSFTWPGGPLPAPLVSGGSATYPSVLPGVDLRLTATPTGVSEVLVVHDARAAANPALAEVAFGLTASGLALSADGGGLTARNPGGTVVFDAAPPRAWDAAGGDPGPAAPGPGSHRAPLGVRLGAGSLTLSTPAGLLTGPGTVYPLYIDPEVTVHGPQAGWLDVGKNTAGQIYGDWEPSDARVGVWCQPDSSGNCPSGTEFGMYRSYFDFPIPSQIWGSGQISATLFTNETWSWTCGAKTTVELWQTGWAAQGITWNSQPAQNQLQSSQTVAFGNTCPAHGVSFDATGAARSASANHWSDVTLELRATSTDESNWNVNSWKRFSVGKTSDPFLQINYDHAPDAPTNTTTLDGTRSLGCAASGTWISSTTPTLQAKIADVDGGNVRASFHYARSGGGPSATLGPTSYLASGSTFSEAVPAGALTDGTYTWDAWGNDGTLNGPTSPACSFSVDTSRPATPTITSSNYTSGQATNAVGTVGSFTFSDPGNVDPTDGVNDVVGYRYGFSDPPLNYVAASGEGGSATVSISPVWLGSRTLSVVAVDRAGNLSPDDSTNPPAEFSVATIRPAGNPTPLLAEWKLDEGSGTTAGDATGNGHAATLGAQAGWGPGPVSGTSALSLTGASDSEAFTAPQVPPVDNTGSFTVSAWVKLSPSCASTPSSCGFYDPVSMDGVTQAAFALEYMDQTWCPAGAGDGVNGCWAFTMNASDTTNPPASAVEATTPVVFGTWVHLTGVFDQVHQTIQVYVNGQPAGVSGPVTGVQPWAAPAMGPLRIGRVLFNGGAFNWWPGEVSDVCTFWGALDATQVGNVFNAGCASAGPP